jgi:threonine aldolase
VDDGAVVDLRSDTFTLPDQRMREAMAGAEVGDDVWGEDPTVRRLEERIAGLLGKQAAVFTPSGTMANLCAIAAQTRPGDEVIADSEAHVVVYEVAGSAVVAGVQLRTLAYAEGAPSAAEVTAAVRAANIHHPISRLLVLENTHNRRGGLAVDKGRIDAASAAAHEHGLRVHCDGARLFNAAAALDMGADQLVASCDSVSVCFSKGLGAPVGSALVSDAATIDAARVWRKRLGGGMRQAGVIAAAALDALERNRSRLRDDHDNARLIAEGLSRVAGVEVVRPRVATNIVMLRTVPTAVQVVDAARERGVLLTVMDTHLVRCMTYLGIDGDACRRAVEAIGEALAELAPAAARGG